MKALMQRRFWPVFVALALCVAASMAVTVAYFTDYEQAQGSVELNLGAQTEITENVNGTNKTVQVRNTGQTDVYTRVRVFAPGDLNPAIHGDGWSNAADGYWYYDQVLAAGASTSTLAIDIDVPEGLDADTFNVIVVQEAVQVACNADGTGNPTLSWQLAGVTTADQGGAE